MPADCAEPRPLAHKALPHKVTFISGHRAARHFLRLFDQHNELDQKIKNMEASISPGTHDEIETLKKEKLQIKDQLYVILKKAG